jgi:hypothetical protein
MSCAFAVSERLRPQTYSLQIRELNADSDEGRKWGGPPDDMRDRPKRSAGFNTRDPSLLASPSERRTHSGIMA